MRYIVLTCMIILMIPCYALAKEDIIELKGNGVDRRAMPVLVDRFETINNQEIEYKNDLEDRRRDIPEENATVEYTTDEEGMIDSVKINNDDGDSVIINRIKGNINEDIGDSSFTQSHGFNKRDGDTTQPVITIYTDKPLEPLVENVSPVDLKRIDEGLKKISEARKKAFDAYMKDSDPYYKKMIRALKQDSGKLKDDGIVVPEVIAKYEERSSPEPERKKIREAVDETMQEMRKAAGSESKHKNAIGPILEIERLLSADYLRPNSMIYDRSIRESVAYLNIIIDEIIKSKLAVYLDANQDKIEAVVQLSPEVE